jgi:hypothetical protein
MKGHILIDENERIEEWSIENFVEHGKKGLPLVIRQANRIRQAVPS